MLASESLPLVFCWAWRFFLSFLLRRLDEDELDDLDDRDEDDDDEPPRLLDRELDRLLFDDRRRLLEDEPDDLDDLDRLLESLPDDEDDEDDAFFFLLLFVDATAATCGFTVVPIWPKPVWLAATAAAAAANWGSEAANAMFAWFIRISSWTLGRSSPVLIVASIAWFNDRWNASGRLFAGCCLIKRL